MGALEDALPLKLSDRRKDVEGQPSGRGGGVDILGQRPEAAAAFLDRLHDVEKVAQRPGKAVVSGDHDDVPNAELIEEPVKLGAFPDGSGNLFRKDPLGTGGAQGVGLAVKVLVARGDAGIADNHFPIVPKTSQNVKAFGPGVLSRVSI